MTAGVVGTTSHSRIRSSFDFVDESSSAQKGIRVEVIIGVDVISGWVIGTFGATIGSDVGAS